MKKKFDLKQQYPILLSIKFHIYIYTYFKLVIKAITPNFLLDLQRLNFCNWLSFELHKGSLYDILLKAYWDTIPGNKDNFIKDD